MSETPAGVEAPVEGPVRELLERSTRCRVVSLLLAPPDRSVLGDLAALAPLFPSGMGEAITRLAGSDPADAQGEYHRLIGSGGSLSACATGQDACGPGLKATVMADASGFYRAFAYDPSARLAECPDHASVLFGFAGYLALKEALALHRGDTEGARVCRDAAGKFQADHIARWFGPFLDRLRTAAGDGHIGRAAGIVAELTGQPWPGRAVVLWVPACLPPEARPGG